MSDYSKLITTILYSGNSDYSDPEFDPDFGTATISGATQYDKRRFLIATAGTTITTSGLTYLLAFGIYNLDPTNYVQAVWTYTDIASADTINKQQVPPGGVLIVQGLGSGAAKLKVSANLVVTAHTAACSCDVVLIGN